MIKVAKQSADRWSCVTRSQIAAMGKADLSACAVLTYLALATYADKSGGKAWPAVASLAKITNADPRSVRRCLRDLETAGLIRTVASKGGRNAAGRAITNVYHLLPVPLLTLTDSSGLTRTENALNPDMQGIQPGQPCPFNPDEPVRQSEHGSEHEDKQHQQHGANDAVAAFLTKEGIQGRKAKQIQALEGISVEIVKKCFQLGDVGDNARGGYKVQCIEQYHRKALEAIQAEKDRISRAAAEAAERQQRATEAAEKARQDRELRQAEENRLRQEASKAAERRKELIGQKMLVIDSMTPVKLKELASEFIRSLEHPKFWIRTFAQPDALDRLDNRRELARFLADREAAPVPTHPPDHIINSLPAFSTPSLREEDFDFGRRRA